MIAFTFPGQGSQKPGVGAPWKDTPSWSVVEEASQAAGRDAAYLLLEADADELKRTDNAQLATYVASLVVLDAARRRGLDASFVAGHSLGEYTALTAAGVLTLADGVKLVSERGAAMRDSATAQVGTMAAALGAADEAVEAACAQARAEGAEVWVANYNAPGQVVVAGSLSGIAHATPLLQAAGAKRVMAVPVSGAFHTPFMAAAQARLDAALSAATMSPGRVPVGANVDGLLHGPNTNWSGLLARQLCSPVRWSQLLGSLCEAGVTTLIELGPGTVLSGLAKRGAPGARAEAASTPAELNAIADLKQAELERTSARDAAGEQLDAPQRLVISHVAGVFCPADGLSDGDAVTAGDVIGRVGNEIVRSRFTGRLMGLLAWRGERVAIWQPLLWLRVF